MQVHASVAVIFGTCAHVGVGLARTIYIRCIPIRDSWQGNYQIYGVYIYGSGQHYVGV
jgi:hypothetical protein